MDVTKKEIIHAIEILKENNIPPTKVGNQNMYVFETKPVDDIAKCDKSLECEYCSCDVGCIEESKKNEKLKEENEKLKTEIMAYIYITNQFKNQIKELKILLLKKQKEY